MNASRQHIALDLNKPDSMVYVEARTGDTAVVVSAGLTAGSRSYEITDDVTAVLAVRKPNGSYIYAAATIEENRVEVALPATLTAAAGEYEACFHLAGTSSALSTPPFTISVKDPAAPEET